jgi:hypothetical protein
MDLTPYVDSLRRELATAAEAGGEEARVLAERLAGPLESAVRLVLLDALSAAAQEITRDLAPGSVDLRLRGREPGFVVTLPPPEPSFAEPAAAPDTPSPVPDGDDGVMARINLRLTETLKTRIEQAAGQAGLSTNAWLVRAAAIALGGSDAPGRPADRRSPRGSQRQTGWVR